MMLVNIVINIKIFKETRDVLQYLTGPRNITEMILNFSIKQAVYIQTAFLPENIAWELRGNPKPFYNAPSRPG